MTTTGFQRIDPSLFFERELDLDQDFFQVTDICTGLGRHHITLFYHFDKSLKIHQNSSHEFYFFHQSYQGIISINCLTHLKKELIHNQHNPLSVRVTQYGKKDYGPTLKIQGSFQDQIKIKTTFKWLDII